MRCKICGYVFDENKKTETCKWCTEPHCKMVRCPNCGYETLPESKGEFKFIDSLKKKFRSGNK